MRWHLTFLLLVLLVGGLACQGQVTPLSAQAGSTILIPIGGTYSSNTSPDTMGFGGDEYTDYQRGELVYMLGGPGGVELDTRATVALPSHPNSVDSTSGIFGSLSSVQYASVVDIPTTAPTGEHTLHVVRRVIRNGQTMDQTGPTYNGTITILPNQITQGVPVPVVGERTDIARWDPFKSSWLDESGKVPQLVPRPEIRIGLDREVWALELALSYPPPVIDVQGSAQPLDDALLNQRAITWLRDDESSATVFISAAAQKTPLRQLSLVFTLDDGSAQVLDPTQLGVVSIRGYDDTGSVVTVNVSSFTIR